MKVLCIINDLALNQEVRAKLENLGMFVDIALDSTSGLALYKSRQYQFLILSQGLPDFTGLETIEIISTLNRLAPTIMLVKPEEERSAIQAMKLGASDYIILDNEHHFLEQLAEMVHLALRHHQLLEQKRAAQLLLNDIDGAIAASLPYDLVVTTDLHGMIQYASPSHTEVLGYEPIELIQKSFFNLVHPDDVEAVREAVSICLLTQQRRFFEYRIRSSQAEYLWVHCTGDIVLALDDEAAGGLFTSRDITARKKAEQELVLSQERFRTLFEGLPVALYRTSLEGQIIDANFALVRLLGYPDRQTLLRVNVNDILVDPTTRQDQVARIQQDDVLTNYRMPLHRYDQKVIWVKDTAHAVMDTSGHVQYFEGSLEDITQRIQAETALLEMNEALKNTVNELQQRTDETLLLNEMGDMLQSCQNSDQAYAVIAEFAARLFPGTSGDVFILDHIRSRLLSVTDWHPNPNSAIDTTSTIRTARSSPFSPDDCWGLRRGKPHIILSSQDLLRCRHVQPIPGEPYNYPYICTPLIAQSNTIGLLHIRLSAVSPSSHIDQLASTVADRGAQALANLYLREELREQATQDSLTGLFNRRYLEETLEKEIARAQAAEYPVVVIMFDIDYFKSYNDRFGHPAGDDMLREIGRYLRQHTFPHESPCLYGGDEFFVILPGTSLPDAASRASEWRIEINAITLKHDNMELGRITLSIGLACFPANGKSAKEVMKSVDVALYQAKSGGRNRLAIALANGS